MAELNELADEAWPGEHDESGLRQTSNVSLWGPHFSDLMDHPDILPYLVELMGPKFRIDHDYCMFMRRGTSRSRLHGGPSPQSYEGDHWYRFNQDGTIRNGLTVFTYNLTDCNPGEGGFACVPGSHKTNLLLSMPEDVKAFERSSHYVRQPPVKAGGRHNLHRGARSRHTPLERGPRAAAPCSTSTAPDIPRGAATITIRPTTPVPASSSSASWHPRRSARDRTW